MSDQDVSRKWLEMAPLIDRMMERVGTKGEFPVEAGSPLAGDDKASDPYQTSHALRMCLTAGVDHLHAIKVLVLDQQVLHVAAPSSLARGALENFGAAYWILGPRERDDRVTRTLRWYAKNFKDGDTATQPLNLPGHVLLADKMDKIFAVGAKRSIPAASIRGGYTSTETVMYAEANAPQLPLGVVLPWRLCSGFAHGRPWAYLGMSNREEETSKDNANIVNVRLTSDLMRALYPALAALQLLERFLRLYAERSGCHLAQLSGSSGGL
ncbi:hypothetical protein [Kribbella sp. NPDC050459]|uniref:hypothetical protein n=1 Tax=Kribbella sp. NPDC050459 TaxID=3155785 RepID=UPI0033BFF16F